MEPEGSYSQVGRDSSVGIATRARLSGDRIPVGKKFSSPVQTDPGAHPASYTMDTGSFPEVNRPGRRVDQSPHLAPRLKKSRAIPVLLFWPFFFFTFLKFDFRLKLFKTDVLMDLQVHINKALGKRNCHSF